MRAAIVVLALALAGCGDGYQTAKVIDGDSLEIAGKRVRLYGIDAPELMQWCLNEDRKPYRCGLEAKHELERIVRDTKVKCQKKERDRYGRELAICVTRTETDLAAAQVGAGQATAYRRYTDRYDGQEDYAKRHRLGIWRGSFERPEQFRHKKNSPDV